MSRVQLALNVTDVDAAVAFYEKVFATPVTKRRPGYANFAIAEPPLKLVLIENSEGGTLNHLGVEVQSTGEVNAATSRFVEDGLTTFEEQGVECCYAKQDKVWLTDPDGRGWEFYTVLSDSQKMSDSAEDDGCCTTTPEGDTVCCSA
jgi:catechol 2,3-dioxygenase-like lactoylglutathione lyase family enzyme